MIVQCDNCQTSFNLDESALPPEGAWVRCSKCDHTFEVLPPGAQPAPAPEPEPSLEPPAGGDDQDGGGIDLDLGVLENGELPADEDFDLDAEMGAKKGGCLFRTLFWTVTLLALLALAGVGGLIASDRMGMFPGLVDKFRDVPVISKFLSKPGQGASSQAGSEKNLLNLQNVRGSYRNHPQAQRMFVIQGLVRNDHKEARAKVLVRGRLFDVKGKPIREAVVYAGPVLTREQLRDMPLSAIQAHLAKPTTPGGGLFVVQPKEAIPFMIVFGGVPNNLSEFTAESVGSQKVQPGASGK